MRRFGEPRGFGHSEEKSVEMKHGADARLLEHRMVSKVAVGQTGEYSNLLNHDERFRRGAETGYLTYVRAMELVRAAATEIREKGEESLETDFSKYLCSKIAEKIDDVLLAKNSSLDPDQAYAEVRWFPATKTILDERHGVDAFIEVSIPSQLSETPVPSVTVSFDVTANRRKTASQLTGADILLRPVRFPDVSQKPKDVSDLEDRNKQMKEARRKTDAIAEQVVDILIERLKLSSVSSE